MSRRVEYDGCPPSKQATSVIPIVAIAWPIQSRTTLLRALPDRAGMLPGQHFSPGASRKRLQLLSQVFATTLPRGYPVHPHAYGDRTMAGMFKEAERAAGTLEFSFNLYPATSPEDITGAFSLMTRERAEALCVFPSPILLLHTAASQASQRKPDCRRYTQRGRSGGRRANVLWPPSARSGPADSRLC